MSGLVLKLGPKERLLINGAVIENGDRRCRLSVVSPKANVLRLRDAIHPEEVTTPVRRVCYIAQMVLSGDADTTDVSMQLLRGIEQLSQVFRDSDSRARPAEATENVVAESYYLALKSLRSLLAREERLMATRPS
jgi:flagellar protein FlbT